MSAQADRDRVAVVGGGVIGASIAFELRRRGLDVLLYERERLGAGATWAAGGMLAPVSEADLQDEAQIALGLDSLARYPQFVSSVESVGGGSCGLRTEGTLWVGLDRDDVLELERMGSILEGKGLAVERLDRESLRQIEPHVGPRVQRALRIVGDHQVDPRALIQALERALQRSGVELRYGVQVAAIAPAAQGWCVRAVDGSSETVPRVVLAAGSWSGQIERRPARPLGVRPVKGQLVRLERGPSLRHVLRSPRVYVIPRDSGGVLLGATVEEMGFDPHPTAGAVLDLLGEAWQVVPDLYEAHFEEVVVGLRPALDDHRPRIGEWERGLYVATGHYRNGVLLAPATAALLAEQILGNSVPELLRPFQPDAAAIGG